MAEDDVLGGIVSIIVFIVVVLLIISIWVATVKIVDHSHVLIIERLGKFNVFFKKFILQKVLKPGIHFIIPFIDKPREIAWRFCEQIDTSIGDDAGDKDSRVARKETTQIDMREDVIDFHQQNVITKDTVSIKVDALVYYRVTDPIRAVYNIKNYPDAIEFLTQATLRDILANMSLDDTFSTREEINNQLLDRVRVDCERWGITLTRVEICNIIFVKVGGEDVVEALKNQIKAERARRSKVLLAEGNKLAQIIKSRAQANILILEAEAYYTERVTRAEGSAAARIAEAESEAKSIQLLNEALEGTGIKASEYLAAINYLKAIKDITSNGENDITLIPRENLDVMGELTNFKH